MALFPAYEDKTSIDVNEAELTWLRNESCPDIEAEKDYSPTCQSLRAEEETGKYKKFDTSESEDKDKEDEDKESVYPLPGKHKKSKKKKKKADKNSNLEEHSKKRKKKSSHKKRKKSKYSSEADSEEESHRKLNKEFSIVDGRQKGVLVDGDFRALLKEDIIYLDRFPDKNNSIFCNTHYTQLSRYHKLRSLPLGMSKAKSKKKIVRYFVKSKNSNDSVFVARLIKQDIRNTQYIPLNLTYEEEQKVKNHLNRSLVTNSSESKFLFNHVFNKEIKLNQDGLSEKDYWQNLNKCFNENLSKDPHNISLWLEFIDIQDKVMTHSFNDGESKMKSLQRSQKSVIERKISVLDSAIGKNIRALELYLKRLHLGETIWEKEKLVSEWGKLVYTFPNHMDVWHHYLTFYQTHFALFHVDHVVKTFSKCSEKLISMQQNTFLSHKPPENLVYELVDITAELAYIWYQGGFMERSIALFQALIELNFFCPQELNRSDVDISSKIEIFEAFWDSKAPRFGESKSVGWAKFMEKKEPVIFPEQILEGAHDEEDEILLKGGTKHHMWIEIEFSRECNHWLSWQEDPENCEDMDRLVSFNVIKQHLFILSTEEEKFYLILKFLNFLGVSIPSSIEGKFPLREYDSVFFPSRVETLENVINLEKESNRSIGLFTFPVIGPSVLKFESEQYFDFICGLIHRFISLLPLSYKINLVVILIGLYTKRILALKRKNSEKISPIIKNYKKNIKNLLKESEFRNDSRVYYEYAKFETSLGNHNEACKIHLMLLQLTNINDGDIFQDNINSENLWRHLMSYVRLNLEKDKLDNIIINNVMSAIYYTIVDRKHRLADPIGALQFRKLRNDLESYIDFRMDHLVTDQLEKSNILSYAISIFCMTLLLIEGFEEVCLTFEKFICKLCSHSSEQEICRATMKNVKESLYFDYLWTLDVAKKDHFKCRYSVAPSLVKQLLKSAIDVSPNNFYFLENFANMQNWRDMLYRSKIQSKKDSSALLATIFCILPHIKKVVALTSSAEFGNVSAGHLLQNLLESAVSSENGKRCPLLWRIYLRLISVTKPKELLNLAYRALHNCPFAKCLYLDCINFIPGKMMEFLKTMSEKGIRIRLPVEELEVLLDEEKEDENEEKNEENEESEKEK